MNQPNSKGVNDARAAPRHSSSFDHRRRPDTLRTAIAMAFEAFQET
jgi:hypothetical protein